MESPYRRRKQPELVRRNLLDEARKLAVEEGLASVTMQAVSEAAGVTKGGCIHHFPSKKDLIEAVFDELLQAIDEDIEARIARDPEPYGSFTRAYINSVFDKNERTNGGHWAPLTISALTDPHLRTLLHEHRESGRRPSCLRQDGFQLECTHFLCLRESCGPERQVGPHLIIETLHLGDEPWLS